MHACLDQVESRKTDGPLKAALKEGRLDKRYLLLCAEQGLPDEGTIEFPLANHPKDQRRVQACNHPRDVMRYEPRPACTRYRVLQRSGTWALVEANDKKFARIKVLKTICKRIERAFDKL